MLLVGRLVVVLLDIDLEAVICAIVASLLGFMFGPFRAQIHFSAGTYVTHYD
jgi:hypothetical protein